MKKIYAYFFVFSFVILSSSLCAMEEEVLPNNQANVQLLKQRIKKYLSKREKYLKHSEDHSDSFLRFEEMIGCYKCDEEELFSTLTKNCNCLNSFTGVSPLISVIQTTGSVLQAEMLLLAGAHIDGQPSRLKNMLDRYRKSSLHTALAFRLPKIVKLLVKYGANPNVQAENGETPLHIAVLEGYVELVRLLLEKGADSAIKNNYDELPLDYAYKYKVKKKIISLLNKNDDNVGHDREQLDYETLLRKKIQELLDYKKNLSERDCRKFFDNELPFSQYLCLGKSIEEASVEEVCKGLDKGISRIDGSTRARWWFNPINNSFLNFVIQACSSYSVNLFVELIILAGADVNGKRKTERFTLFHPLNKAINAHKLDTIPLLLRFGSNPSVKNKNIKPPLISAVEKNLYSVVKLFLEKGVDPNCVNKNGATCLHVAAQRGSRLMVKLLLQHGACANIEDNYKQKAIDYAYMFNDELIVKTFEKWSSDNISLHGIKNKKEIQDITLINAAKKELALYLKENKEKSVESDWFEKYKPKKQSNAQLLKNKINVYFKKQRSNISNLLILCEQIGAVTPSVPNLYKSLCEYDFSTEKATFLLCDYVRKSEYYEHAILVVEMLLLAGANPNVKHEDKSLLHHVCSFSLLSRAKVLVKALLDAGAHVGGESLLLHTLLKAWSPEKKIIDIVEMLFNAGLDMRAQDKKGEIVLGLAKKPYSDEFIERIKSMLTVEEDEVEKVEAGCFFSEPDQDGAKDRQGIAQCMSDSRRTIQSQETSGSCFKSIEKEKILPKNPKNAALLEKKIKEYFQKVRDGKIKDLYYFGKCLFNHPIMSDSLPKYEKMIYENLCKYHNEKSEDGNPVLVSLINRGVFEEVEMVLLAGANPNVLTKGFLKQSPLFLIVSSRRYSIENKIVLVKRLLAAGAQPNCFDLHYRDTVLHSVKNIEIAKLLLAAGADPRIKNKTGKTALDEARENDNKELVKIFEEWDEEKSKNTRSCSNDSMQESIFPKNPAHAQLLKAKIASYCKEVREAHQDKFYDFTQWLYCCPILEYIATPQEQERALYENLCNHYDKEQYGENVFINVLYRRRKNKEIELLLLAGANPNIESSYGRSNLYNVIKDGVDFTRYQTSKHTEKKELIALLLRAGADPNAFGKRSCNTPLHIACQIGDIEMIQLLLDAGAQVSIRNKKKESALDIIKALNFDNISNTASCWNTYRYRGRAEKCEGTSSLTQVRRIKKQDIINLLNTYLVKEEGQEEAELEQKILQFVQQYPARFAEFEKSIGLSVSQDKRSDESNRVKQVLDSLGLFKKTYKAAKLLLDYIADDKRVAEVALLLYAGVDPNFKSILYIGLDKPLILATCINPNPKILQLLLAFEANPNITDRSKISSPLRNVVVANDHQCATMLLRAGAKINDGIKGKSLLRIAQELNNRRMIELLSLYALEEKLEVRNHIYEIILEFEDGHEKHFFNDSLNMIEPRKKQVLDEQYIHIVQQLERLSIDEDEEEEFNDKEFLNSFCRILQKSKADPKYKKKKLEQKIINYLQKPPKQKENCVDIDKKSADFISKVYFCKSEIKEIVQVLLRGCNIFNVPSQNDDGITYAIHHAVKCNDSLFLELLLLAGCDPNKQTSKSKRTALHYAAKKGNLIMIKLLQAAGADVNIKDTNGQTPQEYAQKIDLSKYFEWL